jgi:hypothetical protein
MLRTDIMANTYVEFADEQAKDSTNDKIIQLVCERFSTQFTSFVTLDDSIQGIHSSKRSESTLPITVSSKFLAFFLNRFCRNRIYYYLEFSS